MTMNKTEQKRLDDAEQAARINRALRWSPEPVPTRDLPPGEMNAPSLGWNVNRHRAYDGAVFKAWSDETRHGEGHPTLAQLRGQGFTGSQRGIALYSTKLRALQALRCEVEMDAAQRLASIDAMIAEEMKETP